MHTHTTCTLLVTNSRDEGKEPGTLSLSSRLGGGITWKKWKNEEKKERERELLSGNLIKRKDAASIQPFQFGVIK